MINIHVGNWENKMQKRIAMILFLPVFLPLYAIIGIWLAWKDLFEDIGDAW